uniref:Ig-like domain-containing protein n=1 Tax=Oreochromis niloticus TaxID=8128 RepID=A0A669F856_ORENI
MPKSVTSTREKFLREDTAATEIADPCKEAFAGEDLRARYEKSLEAERIACQEKLLALRIRKWQQGSRMSEEETYDPETDLPIVPEAKSTEPTGHIYDQQEKGATVEPEAIHSFFHESLKKEEWEDNPEGVAQSTPTSTIKDRFRISGRFISEKVTPDRKGGKQVEPCDQFAGKLFRAPYEKKSGDLRNLRSTQGKEMTTEIGDIKKEERRVENVELNIKDLGSLGGSHPVFVKEISSLKVKVGEMSEFIGQFQGDPPPTVNWLKDGHPVDHNPDYDIIQKSNNSKLTIFYPTTDHEGTYDCIITNKHGKSIFTPDVVKIQGMSSGPSSEAASQTVRHKFTFSFDVVGEAPCVVTELENITCSEGETAVLKCVITGEPAPEVTWYHDHICLEATVGKYSTEIHDKMYMLYISNFTYPDAGLYKCVAKNKLGEVTSISEVSYQVEKPKKLSEGVDFTPSQTARKSPYGLTEDFKKPDIFQKAQDSVVLPKVKPPSSQAPTEMPVKTTIARPSLSREPQVISGCGLQGSAAVIKVSQIKQAFESTSPIRLTENLSLEEERKKTLFPEEFIPSVAMSLNQQEEVKPHKPDTMHTEKYKRPSTEDSCERFFSPVQFLTSPTDEGIEKTLSGMNVDENQFLSQARGSLGLSTLQEKVQGIPPAFLKPLMKKNVFENDTLTFHAEVFGLPSPEVNWFRNKTQLLADDRVTIERDGDSISLTIQNVTKADQGEYICEAVNYVGEARSVAVVIIVSQEVRFTPVPPAVSHQHVMKFDVEEDDSSRSPSPQEILLEPVFLTQLSGAAVNTGETARFTVKVSGFPKPTVQWSHNGKVVKSSSVYKLIEEKDEYTLVITQVTSEYEGKYSCTATNRFGQTTCTTYLEVKKPEASQAEKWVEKMFKLTGQPAKGTEASFNYKVSGDPVPDIKWFKGPFQIQPSRNCIIRTNSDGSGFIIIKNAKQEDSGLYTCKASNQFGETACSAELVVF